MPAFESVTDIHPVSIVLQLLYLSCHCCLCRAGQHLISSLCSVGERLFPSSSAAGRDLVRQQMRAAKDRWEARQAASRAAQEVTC